MNSRSTLKRLLLIIACGSLGIAIAGWFAWQSVTVAGPGPHGEEWESWSRTIDVIWMIIPAAFAVSIIAAIASLFVRPRSRTGVAIAVCLIAATMVVAGWFAFVLTHLGIK
ncbi:MAG TPA: hypothetical protein VF980_01205 [Thermoanaerobaculia bacterium]